MDETTIFSPCRKYRYSLWRRLDMDPYGAGTVRPTMFIQFLALNPSTADELHDDNTVRRCINYAKTWGYSVLCMTNIFAYRSTDPKLMKAQDDPIGIENNDWICRVAQRANIVMACWGTHGKFRDRHNDVLARLKKLKLKTLHHFGMTRHGYPKHPLYLKSSLVPIRWEI